MNIRFIDTSIVMNLLRIPHMCQEYESVKKEFNEAIEQNETLIYRWLQSLKAEIIFRILQMGI